MNQLNLLTDGLFLLSLFFSDFAQKLAGALSHNPASTLHTLNLSNNSLEDKGQDMCTHTHTLFVVYVI